MKTVVIDNTPFYYLFDINIKTWAEEQRLIDIDSTFSHEDDSKHWQHKLIKRLFRKNNNDKVKWLTERDACITFHHYADFMEKCTIAIYFAFRPNDPLESFFILRWS